MLHGTIITSKVDLKQDKTSIKTTILNSAFSKQRNQRIMFNKEQNSCRDSELCCNDCLN